MDRSSGNEVDPRRNPLPPSFQIWVFDHGEHGSGNWTLFDGGDVDASLVVEEEKGSEIQSRERYEEEEE